MQSAKNNSSLRFIETVDEFSHQIDILRRDEIVPPANRGSIEEPMNLSCWIRINQTFDLCLQARARMDCWTRDFDFRWDWNISDFIEKSSPERGQFTHS